ncbi:MAG: nitrate reductase molybdenum cofactor assembly chaperone [Cellulomonadaceae bacterium]|jgi:nitrate reductase delta subunit|nr:nitrate reductase molybdenum cofactor assembly chaperone [Cellulomonadaceae bacterium]
MAASSPHADPASAALDVASGALATDHGALNLSDGALNLTDSQRRVIHMAVSLCLGYPDAHLHEQATAVREALADVPPVIQACFEPLLGRLMSSDWATLQSLYVETFDTSRRRALHLTYYAAGDTRRRGHALVGFTHAYQAVGFDPVMNELPDYLPMVLELSALAEDPESAVVVAALLAAHREGLEVLRQALITYHSPWAGPVEAVCLSLGPVDAETAERVAALITEGPPAETVGIETFMTEGSLI